MEKEQVKGKGIGKMTRLEKQPSIVTVDDFLSTYKNPNRAEAKRSLELLTEKGLLPLEYHSELFPQLNILVAGIMWSGSLSKGKVVGRGPAIGLNLDEVSAELINKEISELEIQLKSYEKDNYEIGNNCAAYGRLISQIPGLPASEGSKKRPETGTRMDIKFPDYLSFLIKNYKTQLIKKDRDIARKIILDNINILLQTRLRESRKGLSEYFISLPSRPDKKSAKESGEKVLEMINAVYPDIGLNEDSVRVYYNKPSTKLIYEPRIRLNVEHMTNAIRYGLFDVTLNREFSEFGKNIHRI